VGTRFIEIYLPHILSKTPDLKEIVASSRRDVRNPRNGSDFQPFHSIKSLPSTEVLAQWSPGKTMPSKEALVPDGLPKKTSSVQAGPTPTEFGAKRVGVIEGLIMWHEPKKSAAVLVGLPSVTPYSIPLKCSALTKLLRCIYP
jgi:hypothetical protein